MNHFDEAILAAREVLCFYRKFLPTLDSLNFRADIILTSILLREKIVVDLRPLIDKFCGMLTIDEYETSILINKNHLPGKRYFTIGHELCHYFMHRDKSSHFLDHRGNLNSNSDKDTLPIIEQQANAFSSELLMPREVINAMLTNKFSFYKIAKSIKVSYESLKWRLVRHCIETCGLNNLESKIVVEDYMVVSKAKLHHNAAIFDIESPYVLKAITILANEYKQKQKRLFLTLKPNI